MRCVVVAVVVLTERSASTVGVPPGFVNVYHVMRDDMSDTVEYCVLFYLFLKLLFTDL